MPVLLRSTAGRVLALVAALVVTYSLVTALTSTNAADASTPKQGSVSRANRSVSWAGGPFVVANTSGTAGDPVCVPGDDTSCDDFTLHVRTPAGYGTRHEIRINVKWPDPAADFDVYMFNKATGKSVATAASSADPEVIIVAPDSGDYIVRVVPFAPLGQSYSATATIVDKPVAPEPSRVSPPAMKAFGAPNALPDSHDAGEPSIGVNWKTDATMFQSYLSTYKVMFRGHHEGTSASWTNVTAGPETGCPQGNSTSLDPIGFTDHQTGRTFESQLSGENSLTCYTDDDGTTWSPSTGGGFLSGVDHQTIGGGPFTADNPVPPTGYPNAVYYCSQDIATAFCAVSRDGGVTFTDGTPTYNLTECSGLHGHIQVAPDGTAYLPNKGCGGKQAAVVSTDNGLTWNIRKAPNSTPGDSDPAVGIGSNGTAYFGYVGADGVPRVAVSHNRGKKWVNNRTIGTGFGKAGITNAVFPAVVAGDDNRAAFAFLGTTTDGDYQATRSFKGIWHLYVAYTYDGGKHWATTKVTPGDPVQAGSICVSGTTCGNDRNLLDFIGVAIDQRGFVEAAIADGCTNKCVRTHKNTDSRDAYATIARQVGGRSLLSQFDSRANLTITRLDARIRPRPSSLRARVVNRGGTAAYGVQVEFRNNREVVGVSRRVVLAPGQVRVVHVVWRTAGLHGVQNILAKADPDRRVVERYEEDNVSRVRIRLR